MWPNTAKSGRPTSPIAYNAKVLNHDKDGASSTTSYIEPAARSFGDLEVLVVQAVGLAIFAPAPNPKTKSTVYCRTAAYVSRVSAA